MDLENVTVFDFLKEERTVGGASGMEALGWAARIRIIP
jgi:hypothetical protein